MGQFHVLVTAGRTEKIASRLRGSFRTQVAGFRVQVADVSAAIRTLADGLSAAGIAQGIFNVSNDGYFTFHKIT